MIGPMYAPFLTQYRYIHCAQLVFPEHNWIGPIYNTYRCTQYVALRGKSCIVIMDRHFNYQFISRNSSGVLLISKGSKVLPNSCEQSACDGFLVREERGKRRPANEDI